MSAVEGDQERIEAIRLRLEHARAVKADDPTRALMLSVELDDLDLLLARIEALEGLQADLHLDLTNALEDKAALEARLAETQEAMVYAAVPLEVLAADRDARGPIEKIAPSTYEAIATGLNAVHEALATRQALAVSSPQGGRRLANDH